MAVRAAFQAARRCYVRGGACLATAGAKGRSAALATAAGSAVVGGVLARGFVTSATACESSAPVDVSAITKVAKTDDVGLLPQPSNPKYKTALVQIYVTSQPFGGSDKSASGHRYDSIPIANGMIASGISCQLLHYVPEEHDKFFKVLEGFDAVIVRCNPGQINAAGGDQMKFDDAMRALQKKGKQVWPSPDVMTNMGAKDALCKIANLAIGLPDTLAYYSPEELESGFKKTMAFQPRVIKQNRGSSGEGIWIIKLKSGNYCKNYGDRSCSDDEVLEMMEACDNHSETHTVREFLEFCVNGRSDKSGKWDSIGTGKYLEGGKQAGGQLVDQRFCPRIVEGEIRMNMIGDECTGIIHKKPKAGGISAVGGTGSVYTFYAPDAPEFKQLTSDFLGKDIPTLMKNLGLDDEPLPLWWTADFINADPGKPGTPCTIDKWIVGEFNCSCVGISKCLPAYCKADTPNASFYDIPEKDLTEATYLGNLMGQKALAILEGCGKMSIKKRLAKCNCGQLRVTVMGPDPERISLCHCNLCQKQSGSVFAVQARFPKEQVTIEGKSTPWKIPKSEADQIGYRNCVSLGGGGSFHFCPQCGSTVWYMADADPARIGIKVGCFTDPTFPPPKLSGFEAYMHPWALNAASLPAQHMK